MKTRNVKSIFITACVAVVLPFTASFAQSGHPQYTKAQEEKQTGGPTFKDENIGVAYQHYLHLKTALVASDADEAKKGAEMLTVSLKEVDNTAAAQKEATKIAQASSLEKQRETFVTLSEAMAELVEGAIASGTVYKAYCPMANNNQGATWLSDSKEIRNPYFGDKMLKCGSVKEELK